MHLRKTVLLLAALVALAVPQPMLLPEPPAETPRMDNVWSTDPEHEWFPAAWLD